MKMNKTNNLELLIKDSVLKIGNITEVNGQKVTVTVDKAKNASDMFFEGNLIKNVSVGSFIQIRKGFLTLIGKVDGEKIEEITGFAGWFFKPSQFKQI